MRTNIIILLSLLTFAVLTSACGNKDDLYKADTSSDNTYKPE